MKTYKVSFDYNGINGVSGIGHTWIDASSPQDAMRTVRTLTGYSVLSAIECVKK